MTILISVVIIAMFIIIGSHHAIKKINHKRAILIEDMKERQKRFKEIIIKENTFDKDLEV